MDNVLDNYFKSPYRPTINKQRLFQMESVENIKKFIENVIKPEIQQEYKKEIIDINYLNYIKNTRKALIDGGFIKQNYKDILKELQNPKSVPVVKAVVLQKFENPKIDKI